MPDKIKIAVMLQHLPLTYAKEMRKDHNRNPKSYDVLRASIFEYVQLETGHLPPMQVDMGALGDSEARDAKKGRNHEAAHGPKDDEGAMMYGEDEWMAWYATLDQREIAALGHKAK